MAMKKIGTPEKIENVFSGCEASVLNDHLQRIGKALADFSDDERADLDADLNAVRESESESES